MKERAPHAAPQSPYPAEDEENVFGMNERAAGVEIGLEILVEGHAAWQLFHHSLPIPQPRLPRGNVLKPATLESLWSKYTEQVAYHFPIPVCDSGMGGVEEGGRVGSRGGTVGANQGRKLLRFPTYNSRFTRPAFFKTSGDKGGGGGAATFPKSRHFLPSWVGASRWKAWIGSWLPTACGV